MERVFANLYRAQGSNSRGISHTYFLKRKAGNVLVSHQAPLADEDIDEIESMGGLESQWVCHSHDLMKAEVHQALHDRFAADLHYHKVDRPRVRKKTKIQAEEFDGDGTTHGDDFEAHFLPTCTAGHSIYRWKCRGKYYVFTSHAIYYRGGKWELGFNEFHRDGWSPQLTALSKLHIDYLFPGYTPPGEDTYYTLDDDMRASFAAACTEKARPLAEPAEVALPGPTKGLKLDSDPEGSIWKSAPAFELTDRDGAPAAFRTTARFAWRASDLYVSVVNHEPEMDKLTVEASQKKPAREPEIWKDDVVDILICPDAEGRKSLFQFIVNANGVALAGQCGRGFKLKWGDPIESRVQSGTDRWSAVVKIPFEHLGVARPARGKTIAMNVYRNRVCGQPPTFACWSVAGSRPRAARERFGRVTFGD